MKFKFLIFFFSVFLSSLGHALTLFWGIVGTGRGNGVLGHTFLLVKEKDQPYLMGDAYQYNISAKDGKTLSPADVINNTDNLVFSLKQQKFFEIFSYYTRSENRTIVLYQLDLSEEEVKSVLSLLQKDKGDLHFSKEHGYGLYNNCVTRPLELINQSVDDRRRISYLGKSEHWVQSNVGILDTLRGSLLNRLPFFVANTLEDHPLSKGRAQVYENLTVRTARLFSSIKSDLQKMRSSCGWSSQTEEVFELYTILFLTEPERYTLDPVVKLVKSCESAESLFSTMVLKLYQVIDDKHEGAKETLYEISNQLRVR